MGMRSTVSVLRALKKLNGQIHAGLDWFFFLFVILLQTSLTFAPWWRNNIEYNMWVKMYLNLCSHRRQASSYLSILSWKISRFWVLIAVWIMMDWPLRGKKQYHSVREMICRSKVRKKHVNVRCFGTKRRLKCRDVLNTDLFWLWRYKIIYEHTNIPISSFLNFKISSKISCSK